MRRLAVKICGVTSEADALLAAECGATHIGLIFVESSRRNVSIHVAAGIARSLREQAIVVAVVQDPGHDLLVRIQAQVAPDFFQYHGTEAPEDYLSGVPAIKALSVDVAAASFRTYEQASAHLLFDRVKVSGPDKGGERVNENEYFSTLEASLSNVPPSVPFFVAGGIGPENATVVVSRFAKFPNFCGLDIASGVESSPGVKDEVKIRALFTALKKETDYAISR